MAVIRAFIAINLSPEILIRLRDISEEIRKKFKNLPVHWVPVNNIHLTLKFLGDVSISNLEYLQKSLGNVVMSHSACEISVGGIGAYPKIQQPRIIWVGLEVPQELYSLQKNIEIESEKLGYSRENRQFTPHLTIGRVTRNAMQKDIQILAEVIEKSNVGFLGVTRVKEVHLYRSDLNPSGSVYTSLFTASLSEKKSKQ
jgi:2'-5' RNA ligase